MKKTGFTLAEVLITLSIIGVVAMMTLPALMTNVQEQQARTGIKKGINTLTEAAQMSEAVAGFNYSSFWANPSANDGNEDAQTMYGLLRSRTQVDFAKSNLSLSSSGAMQSAAMTQAAQRVICGQVAATCTAAAGIQAVFFKDGTALVFRVADTRDPSVTYDPGNNGAGETGFIAFFDINGEKAPNAISNCDSQPNDHINNFAGWATNITEDELAAGCAQNVREIKDQFPVFLYRSYAMPGSAATRWAFDN